jgi:predicted 3-demethylubiquinone-9 3-methyltransferase (glyoxalase superfamily)
MKDHIYSYLWLDRNAQAAAEFYCSVLNHSQIINDKPFFVHFEIEDKLIMDLNGGLMFKIKPSVSLFVTCESDEEIDGN